MKQLGIVLLVALPSSPRRWLLKRKPRALSRGSAT
jgi:hypothetical protein